MLGQKKTEKAESFFKKILKIYEDTAFLVNADHDIDLILQKVNLCD